MKYAIVESGVVTNVAISENALASSWVLIDDNARVNSGWVYDSETEAFSPPAETDATVVFDLESLVITRNTGLEVPQNDNKYYFDSTDTIEVVAEISDSEGAIQDTINAPIVKLPVVKYGDDLPTAEEFYLTGNITEGVLSVSGQFPLSGNYKVVAERTNRALDRMPAGFHVSFAELDFLV
jgi:hypothetical protein